MINLCIGLLIRSNYTKALKPTEIFQSRNSGLYAFRTRLGLCVVRALNGNSKNYVSCNKIVVRQTDTKELGNHFAQVKSEVKERDVPEMLKQIHSHDFIEFLYVVDRKVALMSQEDKKFFHILDEAT